jgi:hypothetical protein
MKRLGFLFIAAILTSCGGGDQPKAPAVSKEPVSVRGWIADVAGSTHSKTVEIESNRLTQIFQATQIWVEHADYVSGGVAENGSFILLDVPPGNVTIDLTAPGADQARIVLENIPGNADVFIPGVILEKNGASVLKPQDIKVRVPARVGKLEPTGKMAVVAGVQVPILNAPVASMIDRHDYPQPVGFKPVATFK